MLNVSIVCLFLAVFFLTWAVYVSSKKIDIIDAHHLAILNDIQAKQKSISNAIIVIEEKVDAVLFKVPPQ
jgi:hypothetical protein